MNRDGWSQDRWREYYCAAANGLLAAMPMLKRHDDASKPWDLEAISVGAANLADAMYTEEERRFDE